MEKLPIDKLTTPYKQKCKIDRIMSKQNVLVSKYIGNIMGAYRTKEIVPAEYYGNGTMYPFEDTEFRGLTMFDEYLTQMYGNYMKLPSKEEIDRKVHYEVVETPGK